MENIHLLSLCGISVPVAILLWKLRRRLKSQRAQIEVSQNISMMSFGANFLTYYGLESRLLDRPGLHVCCVIMLILRQISWLYPKERRQLLPLSHKEGNLRFFCVAASQTVSVRHFIWTVNYEALLRALYCGFFSRYAEMTTISIAPRLLLYIFNLRVPLSNQINSLELCQKH